jgi:hypothetical protein
MNVQTMTRHDLEAQIEMPSKAANAGDFSEADLEKIAGGTSAAVAPTVYVAVAVSVLAGAIATTAGAGVSAAVTLDSGGW